MKRQKFTLGARAESNGVVIYDFKEGSIGFKASVSQNGEISSSRISNNFTERTEIMKENSKLPMSVWFVLIFIVFSSIIISVKTQNTWIILAVWYFLAFVWFDSRWAINTFFRIKFQKDYDTICKAKYHAAAHKALNAYEKLKRVPTG